jgi:hypothetical protein
MGTSIGSMLALSDGQAVFQAGMHRPYQGVCQTVAQLSLQCMLQASSMERCSQG